MIRFIRHDDMEQIIELGRLMHAESMYSYADYDEDKVKRLLETAISDLDHLALCDDREGKIVGMFGAYLANPMFSSKAWVAKDYLMYVHPDYRGGLTGYRFIKYFETWAEKRGAWVIQPSITACISDTAMKLYKKLGFKEIGTVLQKEVL